MGKRVLVRPDQQGPGPVCVQSAGPHVVVFSLLKGVHGVIPGFAQALLSTLFHANSASEASRALLCPPPPPPEAPDEPPPPELADIPKQLSLSDLDLDLIREVRDVWQFYRDRRPDMYHKLVAP